MNPRAAALLLLLLAAAPGPAQEPTYSDLKMSDLKADFSVPDMPAFRALGVEPIDILRPADPKAVALMLAEQALRLGVVPESYAVEFAPLRLLRSRNLTVRQYRTAPVLYNARVSAGSARNSETGVGSDVAAGLRLTLFNGADLLSDTVFQTRTERLLLEHGRLLQRYRQEFRRSEGVSLDSVSRNMDLAVVQNAYAESMATGVIASGIRRQRDSAKVRAWNRSVVDFAYAARWSSPDSLARNLELAGHSAWLSWSFGFGSMGQGLFGATASYARADSAWGLSYSGAFRLYGGSNNAKVYADGQVSRDVADAATRLVLGGGTEILFLDGNWLDFSLAWEKEFGGSATLVPSLKYRVTLPENFTKF